MLRRHGHVGRGLLVGAAAGLAASWVMTQFQSLWGKASRKLQEQVGEQSQHRKKQEESEDATTKAVDRISSMLGRPLGKEEKKKAAPAVHYAFGTAAGALYGAAAEIFPNVTFGFGTGFGASLFAVADEIAVPALGLSRKPTESPASAHLFGFASHLVYGATAEGIRRAARAVL